MTTWDELRTVALVGTERRDLPASGNEFLNQLPAELSPERMALHAAALLGIARRVGAPIGQAGPPAADASGADTAEQFAPDPAVQLLELLLSGNAAPGQISDALTQQWLTRCAEHGAVVPYRLLVRVLDHATGRAALRRATRPVLGARGRWLAGERETWSWASLAISGDNPHAEPGDTGDTRSVDLEDLLQFPADERDAHIAAVRAADAAAGRHLIIDACQQLDAASRARVMGLLADQLNSEDEELLEAALDDRSKAVRTVAVGLLNRIITSARATRLANQLAPLVSGGGTIRKRVRITFPKPPEAEQLRDIAPGGKGVIEQQWFDALVTGTPLSWWEHTLGLSPEKIVGAKLSHAEELLNAWSMAALDQENQAWLEALFAKTGKLVLLSSISSDFAAQTFTDGISAKTAVATQAALLVKVDGPWDADFSRRVIRWARAGDDPKAAHGRAQRVHVVMAERLVADAVPDLEAWLESVRGDDHTALQRNLRNLIHQLSLRTSIDKAFA